MALSNALATIGTGAVAALLAARAARLDRHRSIAIATSGLPYGWPVATALTGVLATGGAPRRALLAAALTAVHGTELLPRVRRRAPVVEPGAARVRVASCNTLWSRADPDAVAAAVRSERVDVLALQELLPGAAERFEAAGLAALLPHRHVDGDTGLWSRLPLIDPGRFAKGAVLEQVSATIAVGGRDVRLVAVHTIPPHRGADRWTGDLAALRDDARDSVRLAGPLVLLGDFNATLDHTPLRDLLATGLADAHASLGRWTPTWPADRGIPPLLQLDHVLTGPGLVAVDAWSRPIPGTDHRMVLAELAVTPPPAPPPPPA